jgi:transcriptional regulator with XRE-family HTH domain
MPAPRNKALCRFGEALREERKEKGLSQERLALEAEINRTYMGGVERGEENISLLSILKITDVLQMKPSEILRRAGL